jgi:outer membrane protein TolC
VTVSPAPPAAADTNGWWTGFQDPALDRLQSAAQRHQATVTPPVQAETAAAYIVWRVQTLRLQNATELRGLASAQRARVAGGSPTRDAAQVVRVIDQRIGEAEQMAQALRLHRDSALQRLQQLTGLDPDDLRAVLAASQATGQLPVFRHEVPQRLPARVLRSRPDVAAITRDSPSGDDGFDGWLGPTAQPAPLVLPGVDRDADSTLRQAGHEVAWSLAQLIEARLKADAGARRLDARRLDVLAAQQRAAAGDAGDGTVLEVMQRLLAEADDMAQRHGELALAWVALHASAPGTLQLLSASAR